MGGGGEVTISREAPKAVSESGLAEVRRKIEEGWPLSNVARALREKRSSRIWKRGASASIRGS